MTQCDHTRRAAFIIPILIVALLGLVVGAQAGITVDIGDSRAEFEAFLADQYDLSPESAQKLAGQVEAGNDARILDELDLPHGTVIDYFNVDGSNASAPEANYDGSAVLVRPNSRMAQAYLEQVNGKRGVVERVAKWFQDVLNPNSHMVLVPVGMLGPGMTHDMVSAMAGATDTNTIAIIGTEFPPWDDRSPTASNYYRSARVQGLVVPEVREYPMYMNLDIDYNGTVEAGELGLASDWAPSEYADTPGGPFTSGGCDGITGAAWTAAASDTMPGSPSYNSIELSNNDWTEFDLQNYWWNLLFNRSNRNSLGNYYYANSHGEESIEGTRTDVIGWMRSHHIFDRVPLGMQYTYLRQPGTPLIRPTSHIGFDDEDHFIVRASLGRDANDNPALTIVFARDVKLDTTGTDHYVGMDADGTPSFSGNQATITGITLHAWVSDANLPSDIYDEDDTGGPAAVEDYNIFVSGGSIHTSGHYADPNDYRRHQWTGSSWVYTYITDDSEWDDGTSKWTTTVPIQDTASFEISNNEHWWIDVHVTDPDGNPRTYKWGREGQPSSETNHDACNMTRAIGTSSPNDDGYLTGSADLAYGAQDRGCGRLPGTLFTTQDIYALQAGDNGAWAAYGAGDQDLVGSAGTYGVGNRLKTFAYYHHGHVFDTNRYQVQNLVNRNGQVDDIAGVTEGTRRDRPRPWDFAPADMNRPNNGFDLNPTDPNSPDRYHTADDMVADVNRVLGDNGITLAGKYDSVAYLYPQGGAVYDEHAPGIRMTPRYDPAFGVLLPEQSGLTLAAHEFGHCLFGLVDLYDRDLYNNMMVPFPPDPEHKMCLAMGPYSLMSRLCNGVRVDAWHKIGSGWVEPVVVTEDRLNAQVPQIEGELREPVVYKLPANPYYILEGTADGAWQEYYLIENRFSTGSAYFGDGSPQGLYIYHCDDRKIKYAPRQHINGQEHVEERALMVTIEQADGMRELETFDLNGGANGNPVPSGYDYTAGDPFPGADSVHNFSQIPTKLGNPPSGSPFVGDRWSPTSYTYGNTTTGLLGTTVLDPDTDTDSFTRIVNISDPSTVMTADIFVKPREIIVTDVSHAPGDTQTAHPDYPEIYDTLGVGWDAGVKRTVEQGAKFVGVLALKFANPEWEGGSNFRYMSTGEVIVNTVKILESGTAQQVSGGQHPVVEQAYFYAETNGTAGLQATGATPDSRIGTTTLGSYEDQWGHKEEYAIFRNLGFRVPLNSEKVVYVLYDIREDATTNPTVSVGAELSDFTFILPSAPGAVQERDRDGDGNGVGAKWEFGDYRFPIAGTTATVIEEADKLEVHPNPPDPGAGAVAPATVGQGQLHVPMLQLRMHATSDEVIVRSLKVDATTGAGYVNAIEDINVVRVYLDSNRNGIPEPGTDVLLAESNFSDAGGTPQALLQLDDVEDISLRTIQHSEDPAGDTYWLLSVDIEADAPLGQLVQLRVETSDYIELVTNPSQSVQDVVDPLNFADDPDGTGTTTVLSGNSEIGERNAEPNPPVDGFEPPHDSSISDRTPRFRWNAATDQLSDPLDPDSADDPSELYYELELATDAAMTNIIYSGNTSTALGTTQLILPDANELPAPAAGGDDYYWRLRTVDTEGARSPASTILHFTLIDNQAPTAPATGFWPSGGIAITDDTPTYRWNHATDPDLNDTFDTLLYRQQIDDNPDFSSPLVDIDDIPVPAGTLITDPVTFNPYDAPNNATPLKIGVTYYWRVMTRDLQATYSVDWSPTQTFEVVENRAPYAPIAEFDPCDPDGPSGPLPPEEVGSVRPTISWNTANPPDPDTESDVLDTLDFYIDVKDDANLDAGPYTTQLHRQIAPGELAVGEREVSILVDVDLLDNEQYWYRIRARDLDGTGLYSDWSDTQTFYVNLQNDTPEPPKSGFSPNNGVTVNDATTTCYWDYAEDPDPTDDYRNIHYILQWSPVGTSQADFEAALAYQVTTNDGVNQGTAPEALTDLQAWYWRVCSVDDSGAQSDWSAIQDYYLDTGNQAPVLSAPTVSPYYGGLSTFFEYQVTYTDNENDAPGGVNLTIDSGLLGEQTLPMAKVNPADNNYRDGVVYAVGVTGNDIGYGTHSFVFSTVNGARSPDVAPTAHAGPTVGYKDVTQLWFRHADWSDLDTDRYEETGTVYVELYDEDENLDPGAVDQVRVYIYDQAQSDIELVTLDETGVSTGWFRGSIPIYGRTGASGDGLLNIVAGSGVTINALYQDKDDTGNPYPDNPDPDTRTDTAVVEDTIGPEPITPAVGVAAAVLTATSGVHGRDATLNWSDYNEGAQIDVAAFYIYYSESNFNTTADAGVELFVINAAMTDTAVVDGLEPGTDYWFAVVPVDEVPNPTPGNTGVTPVHLLTADITAPTISNQLPAPDATEQELDVAIHFRLADPGVGLDFDSPLTVTVDGVDISADVTVTEVNGDLLVDCDYTPPQPFNWNDTPEVRVKVADKVGNALDTTWTFAVLADVVDPLVTQLQPADAATGVGVNSTVSWHLTDEKSGIDLSTLAVAFQGNDITADVVTTAVTGNADILCVYTPAAPLLYNSTYTVSVTIGDVAGNMPAPTVWTFDTEVDNTGVTIDRFVPQRNATGVAVDTNIGMRMTDTEAGVNADSIQVTVSGTDVSADLTKTVQGSSVTIDYDPPTDFDHNLDVFVNVSVEDNVGNLTALTYSFRTAPPATYVISGRILTATQAPVVGARISWNGNPADDVYSDGNGAYLITGAIEVPGGYDITPTKDEWTFTPATQNVYVGPDDVGGVDFTGALTTYAIRGMVVDRSGVGLAGVTIAYGNSSVQTAANGTYEIAGLVKGQYTLTPSKQYYHFEPVNRVVDVTGVAPADVEGMDFTGIPNTFSVSGTVYDSTGGRVEGAEVSDGTNVAITNSAGRYTLTNVEIGTHTVSARKLGYSLTPAFRQVTVPPNQTEQDFTAYLELSNSFAAGINLIGVPGEPVDTNPIAVFGTTSVLRWDPSASPAAYLSATQYGDTNFMQVEPGAGFWVRFGAAANVAFAAEPTAASKTVSFGIGRGWNMIANPYASPTLFGNFQPTVAGATEAYGYIYNTRTGSYELISSKSAINATRKYLLPWEGAWVLCSSGGTSLTVTSSATVSAADGDPAQADIGSGYVIPVVAAANGMTDALGLAGVVPGAGAEHTLANPPAPPAGVDLYFVNDDGATLAREVRGASTGSDTFKFVVNCGVGEADVTVALPDLSSVPARYDVMLTDVEANKTVYARTMQSYVYRAAADNPVRHFELTVAPKSTASLTVTTASATQAAQGVVISYNVSQACRVNMTVRNMAGRCIKVLSADGTATAGLNSAVWSLRSDSGAMVPSGSYLVQIEATTENGQRAQALTRVNVNR